jgi:hypothetical protein
MISNKLLSAFGVTLVFLVSQLFCFSQSGIFSSKKSSFSIYLHENIDSVYFTGNRGSLFIKASYIRHGDTLTPIFTNYKYQVVRKDSSDCDGFFFETNMDCCFQLGDEVILASDIKFTRISNWETKLIISHSQIENLEIELPQEQGCYILEIQKDGLLLLREDMRRNFSSIIVKNNRKIIFNGKKYTLRG